MTANALAGVLNYGFQIQAARRLGLVDFGVLSNWLANVTIMLMVASLSQMLANYFPMSKRRLAWCSIGMIGASVSVAACLLLMSLNGTLTPQLNQLAAVFIGVASSWLGGQVQARLRFGLLGLALFLGAAAKFGTTFVAFPGQTELTSYYLAIPLGLTVAAVILGGVILLRPAGDHHLVSVAEQPAARVTSAAILAVATALLPQLDIINLRLTQTDAMIGQYSRVMLFAKGIFFSAATMLQVALPLHLLAQRAQGEKRQSSGDERSVWRAEMAVIGICSVVAVGVTWIGPWISIHFLGFALDDFQMWILLTCLIAAVQFGLLQEIQRNCAKLDWRGAALGLGGCVGIFGLNWGLRLTRVGDYLLLACMYYSVLLALLLGRAFRLSGKKSVILDI
jgi:hypothetical protein